MYQLRWTPHLEKKQQHAYFQTSKDAHQFSLVFLTVAHSPRVDPIPAEQVAEEAWKCPTCGNRDKDTLYPITGVNLEHLESIQAEPEHDLYCEPCGTPYALPE